MTDYVAPGQQVLPFINLPSTATPVKAEWLQGVEAALVDLAGSSGRVKALEANPVPVAADQAQQYRTTLDGASQLAHVQPAPFATLPALGYQPVVVSPSVRYQVVQGFGAAITDSSAYALLTYLNDSARATLLAELYGPASNGWSTVRFALGTSDFRSTSGSWTWDTAPSGGTDPALSGFSLAPDNSRVIPVLQQVAAINPKVRFTASVWTMPTWMGITGVNGTYPNPTFYAQYAQYLVTCVQQLAALGIPLYGLCPTNEPYLGATVPATLNTFVAGYLAPALAAANLETKVFAGDDSWYYADAITAQLGDATAGPYYDGAAWHAYKGKPALMGAVTRRFPGKEQHLTEMRNFLSESAAVATGIMVGDVVIGSLRNGANSVTLWNLALDQNGDPSTFNTGRQGVVTINNATGVVTRNTGYYAITHLSRFLTYGAVRIGSSSYAAGQSGTLVETVAFQNPDRSIVLLAYNPDTAGHTFNIIDGRTGTGFPITLAAGEISTFVWGTTATSLPRGTAASAPTVPATPTMSATGQSGQITLSWSVPTSGTPLSGYTLSRGATTGTETTLAVLPIGTTSYVDVVAAGTYYYKLTATNAGGTSAASTEASATAGAVAAPATPTVTPTGISGGVSLAWTVPSTTPLDSVTIYRSTSSGTQGSSIAVLPGQATGYADTTAVVGSSYYYTIAHTNTAGTATSAQASSVVVAITTPTYDIKFWQSGTNLPTISWLHTPTSGLVNPAVLVTVATSGSGSCTGVTYGGVAMTQVGQVTSTGGTARIISMWVLAAPPSGAQTVVATISPSASTNTFCSSTSFGHVNQATPNGTAGTAVSTSASSLAATTTGGAATDLVVAAASGRQTLSATTPQTTRWSSTQNNTFSAVTTQAGGTGTITSTFGLASADAVAVIAVALKGA